MMSSQTTSAPNAKPETSLEKALSCARAAIDKKAENVKLLDLSGLSGFTDYFLVCSGMSDRQVQAIATSVESALKGAGYELLSSEGHAEGRWVLMDLATSSCTCSWMRFVSTTTWKLSGPMLRV